MSMQQTNGRNKNKDLQAYRYLIKKFKIGSAAEDINKGKILQIKMDKKIKHLNKTSSSPKSLKDFLSKPIF